MTNHIDEQVAGEAEEHIHHEQQQMVFDSKVVEVRTSSPTTIGTDDNASSSSWTPLSTVKHHNSQHHNQPEQPQQKETWNPNYRNNGTRSKPAWFQSVYSSLRSRLRRVNIHQTVKAMMLSPKLYKNSRKRRSRTMSAKASTPDQPLQFPRSLYVELITAVAEGKIIIADYIQSPTVPLNSPFHYYMDRLEDAVSLGKEKLKVIEASFHNTRSTIDMQFYVEDAQRSLRALRMLIEQKPSTQQIYFDEDHADNFTAMRLSSCRTYTFPIKQSIYDTITKPTLFNGISPTASKYYKYASTRELLHMDNSIVFKSQSDRDSMKRSASCNLLPSATEQISHNWKRNTGDVNNGKCSTYDRVYDTISSVPTSNSAGRNERNMNKSYVEARNPHGSSVVNSPRSQRPTAGVEAPPGPVTSFVIPTAVISLERFTTNMYVVPDCDNNRIMVIFGTTQINTIKLYNLEGKDCGELELKNKWDINNAYRVETIGRVKSSLTVSNDSYDTPKDQDCLKRLIVNEVKGYLLSEGIYALKQRLLYFDVSTGDLVAQSKRLMEVINPLESVNVDDNGDVYIFDTMVLKCLDNWIKGVEKISEVSIGQKFIACLSHDQVIICNKDGNQKYSWSVKSQSARCLRAVCLHVHRDNHVYVLAWATDAWPPNNLLLKFDEEGRIHQEIYLPNRISENSHGQYEFDCGPRQRPTPQFLAPQWQHEQQQQQTLSPIRPGAPQLVSPFSVVQSLHGDVWASQASATNQPRPNIIPHATGIQPIEQQHLLFDETWFYATWFSMTKNGAAIVTNIVYDHNSSFSSKKIIVVPI